MTRYVDGGFRTKTMSEDDLMELGPEYDDGEYTWVGDRRGVRGAIRDVQYNAEGYYGNEASTTTFYASAALIITVPPFAGVACYILTRSPSPGDVPV